jgi:hypothetical protein
VTEAFLDRDVQHAHWVFSTRLARRGAGRRRPMATPLPVAGALAGRCSPCSQARWAPVSAPLSLVSGGPLGWCLPAGPSWRAGVVVQIFAKAGGLLGNDRRAIAPVFGPCRGGLPPCSAPCSAGCRRGVGRCVVPGVGRVWRRVSSSSRRGVATGVEHRLPPCSARCRAECRAECRPVSWWCRGGVVTRLETQTSQTFEGCLLKPQLDFFS